MMRRTTALITVAALAVAGGITGLMLWLSKPSYDDIVDGCQKAVATQMKNDDRGKPAACKDVKDDDYVAIVVSLAVGDMSQTDRDTLDYYDDGEINGSIGN